ncbi:MAG: PIN domain-containing protein [Streptosporangiales bacterium]|nr:PIN domain-containing protein [Streptosporangiales bacterium]
MSAETCFVDTNVLVYAYDADAGRRHDIAAELLTRLWRSRTGAISTQVLQEFYVNVTRKLPQPLDRVTARGVLWTYRAWPVHSASVDDVMGAAELEEREQLSFWDALIIVSAVRSGAARLLTEDMQEGRRISGVLIENPFSE